MNSTSSPESDLCPNLNLSSPIDPAIVHWFGCNLPRWHALVLLTFHLVIILVNLPTLLIFIISRELKTKTSSVFFACLALSDLLSTISYLLLLGFLAFQKVSDSDDHFSNHFAAIYEGIRVGMILINYLNFALASLYRMIALRFPVWYQCKLNRHRTILVECGIWAGSLLFGILNFLPGFLFNSRYDPGTLSVTLDPTSSRSLIPMGVVLSLPLGAILVLNAMILASQIKKKKNSVQPIGEGNQPINNSFSKPYRTLVWILLFFYISWVPIIISQVLNMTLGGADQDPESSVSSVSPSLLIHYMLGLFNKFYSIGNNAILYHTQSAFKKEVLRYFVEPWRNRCSVCLVRDRRSGANEVSNEVSDLPTFWLPNPSAALNRGPPKMQNVVRQAFV